MTGTSRHSRLRWTAAAAGGLLVASLAASPALAGPDSSAAPSASKGHEPPQRVVFIVLDQLRPAFIKKFDMKNVKALIRGGTSFPNAYLGHMASETVISHNVMTSGQLPKHMGWSDEWFRDSDGVLGPVDEKYVTGSMDYTQFDALIQDKGYPKLADYLHAAHDGSTVATVGEKGYAVHTMGGPGADIRLTFSGRNYDCEGTAPGTWRGPTGPGVPTYISDPECGRYYVNSAKTNSYGTATTSPAWMYPLDGNRDYSGTDQDHLGGDIWVTDAAFDIMDNETDWSGMLLTYGGIDKAGHMWGGLNDVPPPDPADPNVHMANMARIADEQVGRVIAKLKEDHLLDETLVVLTTDHAQQQAKSFYGDDGAGRGNLNWYYGSDADTFSPESYLDPSAEIEDLINGLGGTDGSGGNVRMSMQDSAIRTWLTDTSTDAKKEAADVMATLGGVRATYYLDGNRYRLRWSAPRSGWTSSEWSWWKAHGQEIVNTMAAPYGPDVVGLLADDTSYGVAGDHGGAQKPVQQIPIVFYGDGIKRGKTPGNQIRSVDILPTILEQMGIAPRPGLDGTAQALPGP